MTIPARTESRAAVDRLHELGIEELFKRTAREAALRHAPLVEDPTHWGHVWYDLSALPDRLEQLICAPHVQ